MTGPAATGILPLAGIRIVEFGGIGPGPFAGMMLADAGAEVVRIDRPGPGREVFGLRDTTWRGRAESIPLDLKTPAGRERALEMLAGADGLIEGFRPGVMERLGLGPAECHAVNPALAYGRMTGWGQDSPKAREAGHDINYLALSGNLHAIGAPDRPPPPPVNFVADYGGGGMLLAFGLLAAILRARAGGGGAVIDAAMLDGAALQGAQMLGWHGQGAWSDRRGSNFLDGGAPFYRCYATACGGHVSVGALEDKFYRNLLQVLDLAADPLFRDPYHRPDWPRQAERLAVVFAGRTRAAWVRRFAGREACVEPVLTLAEAPDWPANRARGVFRRADGLWQPAPAPRFRAAPGVDSEVDSGADSRVGKKSASGEPEAQ